MKKELKIKNDCRLLRYTEIIDTILESRGIEDDMAFLYPDYDDIAAPEELENIDTAYECLMNHMNTNEKICVYYDTDQDGICSGTIIYKLLNDLSEELGVFPDIYTYINDGKVHGVTNKFCDEYVGEYDLIIVVDSLNSSIDNYKKLVDLNSEIIVLDHHDIDGKIKYDEYVILVSSQKNYHNKDLCGAGVCFQFSRYVCEKIGMYYAKYSIYAAAGTISDMMDMTIPENRAIVNMGFRNNTSEFIGKVCGGFGLNSKSIAFSLAPLVNGCNRMCENDLILKAFKDDDATCVSKLKKLKDSQNKIVESYMSNIEKQIEEQKNNKLVYILLPKEVPSELSGLIGNKVLAIVQRPVLILKKYDFGYAGSMRAAGVEDFKTMCNNTGLAKVDGHSNAAGIVINKLDFDLFQNEIESLLRDIEFKSEIVVDALIDVEQVIDSFIREVAMCNYITGQGFKPLTFAIKADNFNIDTSGEIDRHFKHTIVTFDDNPLMIIKWNDRSMVDKLEEAAMFGQEVTFIGELEQSFIYGNSPKLIVSEIIID